MEDTIGLKNGEPRVMKQKSPSSFKVVAGQSERRKKSFCGGSSSENDEFLRLSPVIKLKVKNARAKVTLTPAELNLTLGIRLRVKPSQNKSPKVLFQS